ncbi:MAG: type II secretion system secretin GspD [Acetobacteraceae bacterium]|nr:type II secretion system secretin GspD [Acetobacteraceae bacterium]
MPFAMAGIVVACSQHPTPYPPPVVSLAAPAPSAAPRVSGGIATGRTYPPTEYSVGTGQTLRPSVQAVTLPPSAARVGPVSLDFADTDLREVVSQVLGSILKVNYTIDPAVKGMVTFHSARPLSGAQLLMVLQSLLEQNGAALVQTGDLYRVLPAAAAANLPGIATNAAAPGSIVIPLRYVSAGDLAKVLTPIIGQGARIVADPSQNAVLVAGDPEARNSVAALVRSFDVDQLAGQSFALFPVPQGSNPKDFATTMQDALRGHSGGGLTGLGDLVKVLPLPQSASVLVVANQPRYLAAAQRLYSLIERQQTATHRTWHVYYLRNSHANDAAYLLQRAFTPNDVTAQPSPAATQPAIGIQGGNQMGGFGGGYPGGYGGYGGGYGGYGGYGGATGGLTLASQAPAAQPGPAQAGGTPANAPAAANPLLGGLEQGGAAAPSPEAMRIIPDLQNNSVLVYATITEANNIEAMLRKIDILPLQVRIDATIAEVTLNDALKYGTQFFFKEGDVNQTLSAGAGTAVGAAGFANPFPAFVLGSTAKNAQVAISALQQVTQVRILSAPQLMVLDGQPAALQVGDLVPYLTQSSQSTLVSGAPVINSINYRQTGVILTIKPRVNSGGEVTLDLAQEVSAIDTAAPQYPGVTSPTFSDRLVQSRVAVQDGQTVGLAGLITDNDEKGNQGIPFLRNVPILGALAGQQANNRVRTELLVLITPHVVYDERSAQELTQDLLTELPNAATEPEYARTPLNTTADPNARVLQKLGAPP